MLFSLICLIFLKSFKMLLLFQKCHFMYFERNVCVSMVTAPAHSQLAALRPRSRPDGPSACWAPSRAGLWAVPFSVAAQSWRRQRISALSHGPGQRREEGTCLCWGLTCPHTWPHPLALHLAAPSSVAPPARAPSCLCSKWEGFQPLFTWES